MKKKHILVTGSGGFILSNLIRKAIYEKYNYSFASLDRVKTSSVLHNIYTNKNHQFYIADVTDAHTLNVIFEYERPDIVIHGAGETSVDDSFRNTVNFIHSNVTGTQNIIDACLKWNVEKLIYLSSDSVYGSSPEIESFSESDQLNPRNPYSVTKASAEMFIKVSHENYGLPYVIARLCHVYGQKQSYDKFIPKIIRSIITNSKMPIFGRGEQLRSWMHVNDACSAILKLIDADVTNETYNISTNHEFSNIEVFHEVCNFFERGYDLLEFVEERPAHDWRYSSDSTKFKNKFEWQPSIKFKDGIVNTCSWYNSNKWFLK